MKKLLVILACIALVGARAVPHKFHAPPVHHGGHFIMPHGFWR